MFKNLKKTRDSGGQLLHDFCIELELLIAIFLCETLVTSHNAIFFFIEIVGKKHSDGGLVACNCLTDYKNSFPQLNNFLFQKESLLVIDYFFAIDV